VGSVGGGSNLVWIEQASYLLLSVRDWLRLAPPGAESPFLVAQVH
jgi:hypothetical protein